MASGAGFLFTEAKATSVEARVGFRVEGGGEWEPQREMEADGAARDATWRPWRGGLGGAMDGGDGADGGEAEICKRRSTRLVSKFHHGQQKLYMLSAYGRSGQCREALKVFQAMKKAGCKPNLIMYNTIIDACRKGRVDLKKALDIFEEMQKEGVEPN